MFIEKKIFDSLVKHVTVVTPENFDSHFKLYKPVMDQLLAVDSQKFREAVESSDTMKITEVYNIPLTPLAEEFSNSCVTVIGYIQTSDRMMKFHMDQYLLIYPDLDRYSRIIEPTLDIDLYNAYYNAVPEALLPFLVELNAHFNINCLITSVSITPHLASVLGLCLIVPALNRISTGTYLQNLNLKVLYQKTANKMWQTPAYSYTFRIVEGAIFGGLIFGFGKVWFKAPASVAQPSTAATTPTTTVIITPEKRWSDQHFEIVHYYGKEVGNALSYFISGFLEIPRGVLKGGLRVGLGLISDISNNVNITATEIIKGSKNTVKEFREVFGAEESKNIIKDTIVEGIDAVVTENQEIIKSGFKDTVVGGIKK